MAVAQQIVNYAEYLFDIAGVRPLSIGFNLLVLGLESTPERDLDEFGRTDKSFHLYGFRRHVQPRLLSLINFMHSKGYSAEPVGRYGYPLEGQINLKTEAIYAGLGKRGKNTIVLHSKYGTRLRFMALKTTAPIETLITSISPDEESPVCNGCSICIDICPVGILEPYHMLNPSLCLSSSDITKEQNGKLVNCDICLHQCPARDGF